MTTETVSLYNVNIMTPMSNIKKEGLYMKNLTKIKFKENGEFNHFPGNTVVANLYTKQDLMEVVDIIQSRYRELPLSISLL